MCLSNREIHIDLTLLTSILYGCLQYSQIYTDTHNCLCDYLRIIDSA